MNRRDTLLAIAAFGASPCVTMAQPDRIRRIGFLSADSAAYWAAQEARNLFPAALKRLGYEAGRNLVIEWRWGEAKDSGLSALAEDLVRTKVELIVARTNASIEAAIRATRSILIVMFNASFPVEMGYVRSLASPGGNVTGTSYQTSGLSKSSSRSSRRPRPARRGWQFCGMRAWHAMPGWERSVRIRWSARRLATE